MNRRRTIQAALAALAAIPGLAWVKPAAAVVPSETAAVKRLRDVYDLLMPGLRRFSAQNPDIDFSIQANFEAHGLLVIGALNGVQLGFCITEMQIRDNVYKGPFAPSVQLLIECLRSDRAAELARGLRAS